jgi:NTE family protein
VIAALYCSLPGDFETFETRARQLLSAGFVRPAVKIAFTTPEGIKALATFLPMALDRLAAFAVRRTLEFLVHPAAQRWRWLQQSPIRRSASRTTILRRVFSAVFDHKRLTELRHDRPKLIIVACELQAKSAFYFAADGAGSWRYGISDPGAIEIAQAVSASASYPAALPALDEDMVFTKSGRETTRRVILTDGGVYDNLGLAPLWPGRSPEISIHVDDYPRIIACRAGYGLEIEPPAAFWPSRMIAVMECIHARAQNLATSRLFDLQRAGTIKALLLPYLGQDDAILKYPPQHLISREEATGYPTDFSAMTEEWINRLSNRGEQLTLALLAEHWKLAVE